MKRTFYKTITFLLLLFFVPALSWAWQGKVVSIADGDTVGVMHDGKEEKIRLYGVDIPEKRQDFGQKAKQFTSDMVFGKIVEVKPVENDRRGKTTDRYDRTVGLVFVDGKCLNEELIKAGYAWVYTQYCKEPFCSQWFQLQEKARQGKIGLWSMPNPTPPWEFRHNRKSTASNSGSSTGRENSSVIYHANTSSRVFHKPGCSQYNCKHCTEILRSREEAISKGFKPCGTCKP